MEPIPAVDGRWSRLDPPHLVRPSPGAAHLLAGVPVERRPLEDEPEALPLLSDEDAALLPLLPQPAVAVGTDQLPARHAAPTQSRRYSWRTASGSTTLVRSMSILLTDFTAWTRTFGGTSLSVLVPLKAEAETVHSTFAAAGGALLSSPVLSPCVRPSPGRN